MKKIGLDKHQFNLLYREDWSIEIKENSRGDQFACFSRMRAIPGQSNYFEIEIVTTSEEEWL